MESTASFPIIRYAAARTAAVDQIAVEAPLEIRLRWKENDRSVSVTMRTPGHDADLALGFLFTEGILTGREQVSAIRTPSGRGDVIEVVLAEGVTPVLQGMDRNFYTTSSCGVCGKASVDAIRTQSHFEITSNWKLSAAFIAELPARLRSSQDLFEHTGGLHASGIFDRNGKLLVLREDVGRHNALDKAIGWCLSQYPMPLSEVVLMLSGRISFELVQKAAMAGIPVVAAVGAPSSLAIELAQEAGITLAGFVREERMNVYTHAERVED